MRRLFVKTKRGIVERIEGNAENKGGDARNGMVKWVWEISVVMRRIWVEMQKIWVVRLAMQGIKLET